MMSADISDSRLMYRSCAHISERTTGYVLCIVLVVDTVDLV